MRLVKSAFRFLPRLATGLLYPPICGGCRCRIAEQGGVCAGCWKGLRFLERPWCERLGIPFGHALADGMLSPDAIANPPVFDRARAAVAFEGIARQLVHGLKFHDRTELAPWMARWMLRVGAELAREADFVVPVPLHRRRLIVRRFNQSAELARPFAALCGVNFEAAALERSRMTRQQVGLGASEREANVRGAFRVPEKAAQLVRGKRVLLIDDVYTTGATVSSAARALLRSGAGAVDVLTFARVLPGDFSAGNGPTI